MKNFACIEIKVDFTQIRIFSLYKFIILSSKHHEVKEKLAQLEYSSKIIKKTKENLKTNKRTEKNQRKNA